MAQTDILEYLRKTPHNSNVNVVKGMLNTEGGGGSGDFSTVVITIVNNSNASRSFSIEPSTFENNVYTNYTSAFTVSEQGVEYGAILQANSGETVTSPTIYVVNGKNFILADYSDRFANCSISGAAELATVEIYGATMTIVVITGDCTITIS